MNDIKFAVVNVGYEDSHVYSVDLFEKYDDARKFMLEDVHKFLEECDYGLTLEDYGQEIVAYDGDGAAYHWVIEPTNIH